MVRQTPYHREEQLRMLMTMTDRTPLIAANWKMHSPPAGWDADDSPYRSTNRVDVIVFPTMLDLVACMGEELITGAQYGRAEEAGAFTGDVSIRMLASIGCTHVLCGHSDRRKFHGESDDDVARQVIAALEADMIPILCVGETLEERNAGRSEEVIRRQLDAVLTAMQNAKCKMQNSSFVVAYEPVWAISRGDPTIPAATPDDAQKMHAFIRSLLSKSQIPNPKSLRLLYGGSMNASNAAALLAQPDIDGGLVGGASLQPEEFRKIVEAAR